MSEPVYIPPPTEYLYQTLAPVRRKLCRIFLYIVQSFTDCDMEIDTYIECHKIVGAAWRRLNDDSEFCEQLELDLPTRTPTLSSNEAVPRLIPHMPPEDAVKTAQGAVALFGGGSVTETYLTKETLLKAVKAYKLQSEALPWDISKNAQFSAKYPPLRCNIPPFKVQLCTMDIYPKGELIRRHW